MGLMGLMFHEAQTLRSHWSHQSNRSHPFQHPPARPCARLDPPRRKKNHPCAGLMSLNSLASLHLAVKVFEAHRGHMIEVKPATQADLIIVSSILKEAADWLQTTGRLMWRDDELEPDRISHDVETGSFPLPILMVKRLEPSSSSSKTLVSGPIPRETTQPMFIGSP
jgi:hypothetical protein